MIRKGDRVRLVGELFSHTGGRKVKVNTPGITLASRGGKEKGLYYLVKFVGHTWPKEVTASLLEQL